MKYILYNPDTSPQITNFLDGVEVLSVTDAELYGYLASNENYIYPEPGIYCWEYDETSGEETPVNIQSYIGADATEEYMELPCMEGYDPVMLGQIHASACTYPGFSYFVIAESPRGNFYTLMSDENPCNQAYDEPGVVTDEHPIYTGTFNLANGTSVVITQINDRGQLFDENGNYHELSSDVKRNFITIPARPVQYFKREKQCGYNDFFKNSYPVMCQVLPNGNYEAIHEDGPEYPSTEGYEFALRFNLGEDNQYFIANNVSVINEPITVTGSSGTQTTVSEGYLFKYDVNGSDVCALWNRSGFFGTGSTFNDIAWVSANYKQLYEYKIIKVGGYPSTGSMLDPNPGVAYVSEDGTVYYNTSKIPVFFSDLNAFMMSFDKEVVFNLELVTEMGTIYELECGDVNITPQMVEKIVIDGVDRTSDYKNNNMNIFFYTLKYYDGGMDNVNVDEIRVTFTDEFFSSGTLTATYEECMG